MEQRISIDPQELNKSMFRGREPWQYVMIALSIAIAIFVSVVSPFGSTVNGLLIAVLVVPTGTLGVFQKYGLDFFSYCKKKYRVRKLFFYETEIPQRMKEEGDGDGPLGKI